MPACTTCGADLPAGAKFCPACGTPIADERAEEMLKLATVLFADVVSSTARAERLHPEEVRALMADYFAAMSAEIRREGGTIEKFVGDAIMAVFGVPVAHEDDAVRAVRAARAMIARLEEWNRGREDPVQIRIGVNTGDVLASPDDQLLVTGDAVNVAARLEQAAQPAEILAGERTARAVRGVFELQPLEALQLKGKTEGVAAWRVGSPRDAPDERGVPGLRAPLVGRDEELDLLRSTFARVRSDRAPQVVTLLADAGVGKSRLAREFLGGLSVETKVLVGRCLPYGDGVTLWPLAEMLKAEALVLENDAPEVARGKIEALVAETLTPELATGEPDRIAAGLVSTLGADEGQRDPQDVYRTLVTGWRMLLSALAAAQPTVLLVEDVHWADETMLDILDDLSDHVEGPVLIVCTSRPDLLRIRPGWGGGRRNYSSVPLDPLTPDETSALVSALLDVDALPSTLRSSILDRSEGNPFFLEEMVSCLIDEGAIAYEDGAWRATRAAATVDVPDNVQAVILARLDLLEPAEKRVVQRAAVIGRTFWRGALLRLVGDDGLDDVLRTLARRELVVERLTSSMGGDVEYAFKHVLTRDVAYESLPRAHRAAAHADVAAWIDEVSGRRAGEFAEFLAYHYDSAWTLGGREDARLRARAAYLEAAGRATRRNALRQSARFGERAVELSAPGSERAEALETLGVLAESASLGEAAYSSYRAAIAELGPDDPAFSRLAGAAAMVPTRWHGTMHEHPPASELRELVDAGLAAAPPVSRARVLLLVSRTSMEVVGLAEPSPAGASAAREAIEVAGQLDDPDVLSAAYDGFYAHLLPTRRYAEMHEVNRRRGRLAPRLSPQEAGDAHAMLAWSATYLGRYGEAAEHATAAIEVTRGLRPGVYFHALSWRVWARFMIGDWDGALDDQRDLDRVLEDDPRGLPPGPYGRGYAVASFCAELRGDTMTADAKLQVVRRLLATGLRPGLVNGVGYAVRTLVRRGEHAEAWRLFPYPVPEADAACALLEAYTDLVSVEDDRERAVAILERAGLETELGELQGLPCFSDRLAGRLAAADGERDRAIELLRRSADGFAGVGAPWEEAWSRLLLAEIAGDRTEAEHALATFERLGSIGETERAQAFLAAAAQRS